VVTHKESFQRCLDQKNKGLPFGGALVTTSDPQQSKALQKAVQLVSADIKEADKKRKEAERIVEIKPQQIEEPKGLRPQLQRWTVRKYWELKRREFNFINTLKS
jgi:hypothetical protein